ncbi:zinc finger protein 469 [Ambystoma mexicanum]|uniref:zinc finger protein 469 n=1 Tax=Ambystoma mexicanum TaxID=8296 RepID=UPI0037E81C28
MTGETQHAYAICSTDPGSILKEKEFSLEPFAGKDGGDMDHKLSDNSDLYSRGCNNSGPQFSVKDKEPHNQREAVIRPQQAGKIDFKSLYNRPKFTSDGIWNSGKGGPQSPNGKSRTRDKTKRSGKGDRTQHQLYRLSISNSRPNPTIGIAYPQQKVTPPKKVEVSPGTISGSYCFHVPGIPEREAELQQDDFSFHRCFQEVSSNLTSTISTSATKATPRQHHSLKLQQAASIGHEVSSTNGQLHYLEFQGNGTDPWQSPEKNVTCASYSVSVQKACPFPDINKSGQHCYGAVPYQYPFQSLHDPNPGVFGNKAISQDYLDVALAANQTDQGAFAFHPSADELEKSVSGAYANLLKDSRTYSLPAQQTPFLHVQQTPGVQHQPSLPCYKGRNEHSTDLNGANSSSGAINSSGAIEQTVSNFQDSQAIFSASNFSVHNNSITTLANKRQPTSLDSSQSQQPSLRRNVPPNSIPQVHFYNKGFNNSSANNANTGPVPYDKSILPAAQDHANAWDGASNTYLPADQNATNYSPTGGSQFTYQCHSNVEQRHTLKNSRMPWQQGHHTTTMPSQNRAELSRQPGNGEPAFPCNNSEWQVGNHILKNYAINGPSGYHNTEQIAGEHIASQSNDAVLQNSSSDNAYFHDGVKDTSSPGCDLRTKNQFFGMNQAVPAGSSRNTANQALAMPLSSLVSASPGDSPLSSPIPNNLSSSTCSSLSPMSSSPINPSSEENQLPNALTSTSFYGQPSHPKNTKIFHSVDPLQPSPLHYNPTEPTKTLPFPSEVTKEDHVSKYFQDSQFHKANSESGHECLNNFENEPPPPPYSSHHLLANSLSSASLDQLDVLLTCKQCDRNYSNLSTFLEHRQYCGLHAIFQNDMKDLPRGPESRKCTVNSLKSSRPMQGLPLPKGPSDPHEHLHGTDKCADFLLGGDSKGDTKDEPLKVNMLNSLPANVLSVNASDLEIDEAKLDSLITEALNGLGYQSDNPEIDSSFMDAFVDEELSMMKAPPYRIKEHLTPETTTEPKSLAEQPTYQTKNIFCKQKDSQLQNPNSNQKPERRREEKKGIATKFIDTGTRQMLQSNADDQTKLQKIGNVSSEKKDADKRAKPNIAGKLNSNFNVTATAHQPEVGEQVKNQLNGNSLCSYVKTKVGSISIDRSIAEENCKPQRTTMRDTKKRNPRSGTWSKELIHKIVQQKNKLHKLQVKNNKTVQVSLVAEKTLQPRQSLSFAEYDYVSDSDDDVASAKRHANNQPNERLKYTFTSKHHGVAERSKTKQTAWKCSKTKDVLKHPRDSDSDSVMEEVHSLRSRRRSSGAFSSSVSGEVCQADKSTEMTDSGNEKETGVRRKYSYKTNSSRLLELETPETPTKESSTEKYSHQKDLQRGTKRYGSAKFLLAGSKVQLVKSNTAQSDTVNQDTFSHAKEKLFPIYGAAHQRPEPLFCREKASGEHRANNEHTETTSQSDNESEYRSEIPVTEQDAPHQFPAYSENKTNCNAEEIPKVSLVGNTISAAPLAHCTPANMANAKDSRLSNDPKDFGYYNSNPHSMEYALTTKEPSTYDKTSDDYEQKDMPNHYDSQLLPKPLAMETPETGDMYLCHNDISSSSFDHKASDLTSFTVETGHKNVASPLDFDSASIFGELPVSGYGSPLYANVSATKEDYVSYPCHDSQSSKTSLFEQPYPPFLQEKDWELMQAMSPLLPPDQFHNSLNKKHDSVGVVPSGEMSIESISGCNVPFMSSMSVDELEIKRLVTELECQLQTSKSCSLSPAQPSAQHQMSKDINNVSSHYSNLSFDHVSENESSLFLSDELNNLGNTCNSGPMALLGSSLEDIPLPAASEEGQFKSKSPKSSWTYSVAFDSLEPLGHPSLSKDSDSLDPYNSKEEVSQFTEHLKSFSVSQSNMSELTVYGSPNSLCDVGLSSFTAEDRSTKSPNTFASDPSSAKESVDSHGEATKHREKCHHEQNKPKRAFDDPPNLEPFQSQASDFPAEFELNNEVVSLVDMALSPSHTSVTDSMKEVPSRNLAAKPFEVPIASDESSLASGGGEQADFSVGTISPPLPENDDSKHVLFDIPNLDKEEMSRPDNAVILQGSEANPLKQLQLFVARTAKNNEEEMMLPCFPGLLSTPHQVSCTEDAQPGESEESSSPKMQISSQSNASSSEAAAEADCETLTLELTEGLHLSVSSRDQSPLNLELRSATPMNSELQNCETDQHHLGDEYSELNDIHISTDAISQNHDSLSLLRDATLNPQPGEVKEEDQTGNLLEADEKRSALTFQEHSQAIFSNQVSFEAELLDNLLNPAVYMCDAEGSMPCDNSCHDENLTRALHLDHGNTHTQVNVDHGAQWPKFHGQGPSRPTTPNNPLTDQENIQSPESDILPAHTEISEKANNTQLSEILNSPFSKDSSSNTLLKKPTFGHYEQLVKGCPEKANISDVQEQLFENPIYGNSHKPTSNPAPLYPLTQGKEEGLLLTLPEHASSKAHMDSSDSISDGLSDNNLINTGQPGHHVLLRSPGRLCSDDSGQLETKQQVDMNIAHPRQPLLKQKEGSDMMPERVNHDPASAHPQEHGQSSITDNVPNVHSVSEDRMHACPSAPENSAYSTLCADLFTEMNDTDNELSLHVQPDTKFENCFSIDQDDPLNLQDMLSCSTSIKDQYNHTGHGVQTKADGSTVILKDLPISEAINNSSKETSVGLVNTDNPVMTIASGTPCPDYLDPVMNGVLNILNCEKSKAIFRSLGLPSSNDDTKDRKAAGSQVTCDICSASFRSKPGLTRHKAFKHPTKHDSTTVPKDTASGDLSIPKKASKIPVANSYTAEPPPLLEQNIPPTTHEEGNIESVDEKCNILDQQSSVPSVDNHELFPSNMLKETTNKNCAVLELGELHDPTADEPVPGRLPGKAEKKCQKQHRDPNTNENSKKVHHGNLKKRKAKKQLGRSSDSQVPSDEILNIIKTNILKAITCPGQSSRSITTPIVDGRFPDQEPCKAKQEDVGGLRSDDIRNTSTAEELPGKKLFDSTENGDDKIGENIAGRSQLGDQEWIDGYLRHVEQNVSDGGGMGQGTAVILEETGTIYDSVAESHARTVEESLNYEPSSPVEIHRTLRLIEAEMVAKEMARDAPNNRFDGTAFCADATTKEMRLSEPLSSIAGEPDYNSLFDDDITFSMLFPRDDHFIRRKCTRVYGKRSKNLPHTAIHKEEEASETFPNQSGHAFVSEDGGSLGGSRDNSATYESASINNSLMRDICHRSKHNESDFDSNSCETPMLQPNNERPSPGVDTIDMESETLLNFLCQNQQAESTPSLQALSSISERLTEEGDRFLTREQYFRSSSEIEGGHFFRECSPEELDLDGPYPSKKQRSPSELCTIDMDFLNAKLETGEIHFGNTCEETSNDLDMSQLSPEEKPNQSHKQNQSQIEDGKTAKSHGDVTLKPKHKQYKCKACFQWFLTLGELNFHKLSHNPCPPPTCYMCVQRKFSSREQLKDHLREKHAKNKAGFWVCGMCLKEISDVWMYNEHLREHATQFARKGQAQSVLGLHGCFPDEATVHSFLTRFIYRKPNKSGKPLDSENNIKGNDPEEPIEKESKTSKDPEVHSIENKSMSPSPLKDPGNQPPDSVQHKDKETVEKNAMVHSHQSESSSPLPELVLRSDAGPKNAPIHPQCKDPSRDCHHCGKQFPKPFKLQRHLVVHSLQKIFLCHRCPKFYQDTQELRSHLRQQHEIAEESEIKHTTLYACEMCADVMHVIKKSFICSTCNYTFSKKEQYDRHMEKHLVEGSKTFKFRSVRRPDPTGKEASRKLKEVLPSEGPPPSKKRRNMPGLSPINETLVISPVSVPANSTSDHPPSGETSPVTPLFSPGEVSNLAAGMPEPSVKMEDEAGDVGNFLPEVQEAQLYLSSLPPCLSPPTPRDLKRDPELDDIPTLTLNEPSNQAIDTKHSAPIADNWQVRCETASTTLFDTPMEGLLPNLCTEPAAQTHGEEVLPLNNPDEHDDVLGEAQTLQDQLKEGPSLYSGKKSAEFTEPGSCNTEVNNLQRALGEQSQEGDMTEEGIFHPSAAESLTHDPVPLKEKVTSFDSSATSRNHISSEKGGPDNHTNNRQPSNVQSGGGIGDPHKPCSSKEKTSVEAMISSKEGGTNNMKEMGGSNHKTPNGQLKRQFVMNTVKHSSSDPGKPLEKSSLSASLKASSKKRKDNLTLAYKSSSNSRESTEGEGKKKQNKMVIVIPGRNESSDSLKKHERSHGHPVLPSAREQALNRNLHYPKPKTGGIGSPVKKMVLDSQSQKKVDGRHHSSGDYKRKKEILGKTLHQLLPKSSGLPFGSPLHKNRTAQTLVKPPERPNYRTAESQNNLLSKLFGQKLTSFKIPLRRDTSE